MKKIVFLIFPVIFLAQYSVAQKNKDLNVIGYFAGRATMLDSFPVGKLTRLIFSFCHLNGNKLWVSNAADTACIQKMVSFKEQYPDLKIILSMGGWGGCRDCSAVFSSDTGRNEFARSSKELMEYFHTDGIDLDWEYPAIPGFPGHVYSPDDRTNFTLLIQSLRKSLGKKSEISFAAGGFDLFIDSSIEWKKVMRIADKVNVMSYDLVHGFSKVSGHHTPLYSTTQQKLSVDNAVNKLIAAGVPPGKIIIGAAFYARFFEVTDTAHNGLYDSASFYRGISYSHLYDSISAANGFVQYWDATANAPYAFNTQRKIFATFDDSLSINRKTNYAIKKKLGGIMFWQLMDDKFTDGLLDVIYKTKLEEKK
ncbi:MAG: glycoside hydrolase family 18 protein [Chitinophagales bacterium]